MRPTVLEISLDNFLYNVKHIQSYVQVGGFHSIL